MACNHGQSKKKGRTASACIPGVKRKQMQVAFHRARWRGRAHFPTLNHLESAPPNCHVIIREVKTTLDDALPTHLPAQRIQNANSMEAGRRAYTRANSFMILVRRPGKVSAGGRREHGRKTIGKREKPPTLIEFDVTEYDLQ